MQPYEFLVGFISIFLALSITKMIEMSVKLWREHHRIVFSLHYAFIVFLLFLLQMQFWWGIYKHREALGNLNFFEYFIYILPVIVLVMMVETTFPETLLQSVNREINLRELYWRICRELYALSAILLLLDIVMNYLILLAGYRSRTLSWQATFMRLFGVVLVSTLAWKNHPNHKKLHLYVLLILTGLFLLFVATQSMHLA